MQQLIYNLDGMSISYAKSLGMFLRHSYFLRTKTARCCGIEGSLIVDGKTCPISASTILPGNALVYDLFLSLNTLDFQYTKQCLDLGISKSLKPPSSNSDIEVTRLSEEIFKIKIDYNKPSKVITSNILGSLVPSESNVVLLKHFNQISSLNLILYLRIGNGCYSDLQNKEDLEALKVKALTYPVMCSPSGDLGYEVSGDDRNSKLIFNYNEKLISAEELKKIFKKAVSDVANII